MKSNIWYVSKYANIAPYGGNSRHANFCKIFSEAKNSYNVRLITSNSSHLKNTLPQFSGSYKDMAFDGYQVTWVNTPNYTKSASIKRIFSWFWFELFVILMAFNKKYEKPDIVIASSLSIMSVFSGCFYKKIFKAKFIFEVRDIWPQTLIDVNGMSPKHPLVWFLDKVESLGYRYADDIIGTMPGLNIHVEEKVGLGNKVTFIPQGVNLYFYMNLQEKIDAQFIENFIPKNKFIVTYTGTLGKANAMKAVIKAAEILDKEGNNEIVFLIVGNGGLKKELMELASHLDNVIFAPAVKKEQVQHILSLSHLLVASVRNDNIYKYGLSLNKFVDYMYSKKPIICMFSGYRTMINEAGCGEFTPADNSHQFAETIKKYQSLPSHKLECMGAKGHNFLVEKRNFNVLGKQFMELFK
jgi:hypothetical protein